MATSLANPARFARLNQRIRPFLAALSLALLGFGLYRSLWASPPDYQQGEAVRMMYVHVPAAWASLAIYSAMALASFVYAVWHHRLADIVARESAPIALAMGVLTLITGVLWGKPAWGTYWVWDARLTSMLMLVVILCGYQMLASRADHQPRRQLAAALFCLFGAINIPIIKFSVEWWHSLHQPASLLRRGGSAVDASMLLPLLCMALAFMLCYLWILSLRIHSHLLESKAERLAELGPSRAR